MGEGADESTSSVTASTSASQWTGPRLRCLITNCCDDESIRDTQTLVAAGERLLGGAVYCTFGVHPHNYKNYTDVLEAQLITALKSCGNKAVGWGECGLDYYKNFYDLDNPENKVLMIQVFVRQARLAVSMNIPLVVHTRDAEEDSMRVFREELPRDQFIHIHAFQGSVKFMREVLDLFPNAVIGISGVVARIRGISTADVLAATSANCLRFYGIDRPDRQ